MGVEINSNDVELCNNCEFFDKLIQGLFLCDLREGEHIITLDKFGYLTRCPHGKWYKTPKGLTLKKK